MLNCTVYSRPNCHLCDQLVTDLAAYLTEVGLQAELELVDIEGDLQLVTAHGMRVPVLTINGDEICFGRLAINSLNAYLVQTGYLTQHVN